MNAEAIAMLEEKENQKKEEQALKELRKKEHEEKKLKEKGIVKKENSRRNEEPNKGRKRRRNFNKSSQLKGRSILEVASSKLVLLMVAYSLLKYLQMNCRIQRRYC